MCVSLTYQYFTKYFTIMILKYYQCKNCIQFYLWLFDYCWFIFRKKANRCSLENNKTAVDVNIVPAKEIDFLLIQWILPETVISFLKDVIPKMLLIYSKSLVQEVNTKQWQQFHYSFLMADVKSWLCDWWRERKC